jgi:4-hydroxy-tetrahydrodipicolinate synthase
MLQIWIIHRRKDRHSMSLPPLHGVIPIVATPFDDQGHLDLESLRRVVDFNVDGGVHGLGIALGSEIYKLTEGERTEVISTVIDQARGRVPVIVNTGAPANELAVNFSRQAQQLGAAAVMVAPPSAGFSANELLDYYRAINSAITIPIMIQDTAATPVPAPLIQRFSEELEWVQYAKIESVPAPQQVLAAVQVAGASTAILGGAAGAAFIEELRRGSIGTMPWPTQPADFVAVWNAWQAGDHAGARDRFETAIAPLLRLPVQTLGGGHRLHKEVLYRLGVIASPYVRGPVDPLDAITLGELDEVCARLGLGARDEVRP